MSDDLVKQLRNSKGWPTLGNAAADRIEELEAKLAQAVEALQHYACDCDIPCGIEEQGFPDCGHKARATLAELKAEKDKTNE